MREGSTLERKIIPKWIRPNLETEQGELKRVVSEFLGREPNAENVADVMRILESAPLVDLSYDDWRHLENTDSFQSIRPGYVEDAKKITEGYNLKLSPNNRRNFQNIVDGFLKGANMECPTILKNGEGKLTSCQWQYSAHDCSSIRSYTKSYYRHNQLN